jgi:hypothetical protein
MKKYFIFLQLFGNTSVDVSYPEFWAASFDALDKGAYYLQSLVSRDYENLVANKGDKVNVMIAPSFSASDWTPGDSLTPTDTTQTAVAVELDGSKRVTFNLTGKETSLSAYDLVTEWGKPAAEAILAAVDTYIYNKMIASPYLVYAVSGLTESSIIDARTALSNRKIGPNRAIVGAPDDFGTLMKLAAFSQANITTRTDVILDGMITDRYGFKFYEDNAISKYTPADLVGAVNHGAGYVSGDTTMVVDGFNDDANPIRKGDVFTVAGSSAKYTVQSTTTTTSDTTGITFLPALDATIADDAAITFVATRSMLAFTQNAFAFASRPYDMNIPGVATSVVNYRGIPIRISVFHDGKLGKTVQMDILFGGVIVDNRRIQKVVTA